MCLVQGIVVSKFKISVVCNVQKKLYNTAVLTPENTTVQRTVVCPVERSDRGKIGVHNIFANPDLR